MQPDVFTCVEGGSSQAEVFRRKPTDSLLKTSFLKTNCQRIKMRSEFFIYFFFADGWHYEGQIILKFL